MAGKHKLAEKDYMNGMKYKEIAEKHEVSINTIKSWKRRHEWSRGKGAPKQKSVHTKRKGGQAGNQNAKGHGAPAANSNAVTHGLFAKYLPDETREIAEQVESLSPLDILWMNIRMQFAQIMRSQQIMHVFDRDDMTKELRKTETSDGEAYSTEKEEWEIQFAWDKQANFLNAQSRAMSSLLSMLKQFTEMAGKDDERVMEAEKMQLSMSKTKKEIEFIEERTKLIKGEKKDTSLLDALIKTVNEDD
ncbi:phage terminase small subunit [Halobacillus sp. Cin3]|uniref:phage terminase small subunit n=1 Tax=Halobacillus sp. Cin3 TaxID=2928441 RepID=UPI00248E3D60|nr:phage terminase small subunit [Halobacillus sp. Cin3]